MRKNDSYVIPLTPVATFELKHRVLMVAVYSVNTTSGSPPAYMHAPFQYMCWFNKMLQS